MIVTETDLTRARFAVGDALKERTWVGNNGHYGQLRGFHVGTPTLAYFNLNAAFDKEELVRSTLDKAGFELVWFDDETSGCFQAGFRHKEAA